MRIFILLTFLIGFSSCSLEPCGDKDQFITEFKTFVNDFRDQSKTEESIDASSFDRKFEKFTKDCYAHHKEQMEMKERRTFWKDAMIAYFVRHKGEDIDISKENRETAYIATELEEVFDGTGKEIEEFVRGFIKEEVPDLIDEAVKGIEKIGEQIKDLIRESK